MSAKLAKINPVLIVSKFAKPIKLISGASIVISLLPFNKIF